MPDIDPASLQSSEPLQSLNPSSLTLSKPNGAVHSAAAAQKIAKAEKDKGQQRVDIEPIYTSLKANIGEKWAEYKDSVGLFVLGQLNQDELSLRVDHLLAYSPETEHLHNCLITALYANCYRDAPEPGVAPWVAANDKPASGIGSSGAGKGGDKVEERLKREVMALPGRDRRRLKEVGEREPYDPNSHYPISQTNNYRLARSIKLPDVLPPSAGGLTKTNWDLEIRKRYTQPLSHESLEFPDAASIQHRMLPICYEEALPNGYGDNCAEFVASATELYVKEIVFSQLSLTRSNFLPGSRSKHALNGVNGAHKGSVSSLGSVGGRALSMGDMRFALGISSCNMGYMPDIITNIMGGYPEGILEGWDDYEQELDLEPTSSLHRISHVPTTESLLAKNKVPVEKQALGTSGKGKQKSALTNGVGAGGGKGFEEPAADGWVGSSSRDRHALFSVLDDCLSFGQ